MKSILHHLRPVHRALISTFVFVLVYLATNFLKIEIYTHLLLSWIGFCISYLSLSWYTIYTMPAGQIKHHAGREDGSRMYVISFILVAAFSCMLGIIAVGIAAKNKDISKLLYLSVAIFSLLLSWLLVHTLYIFHYAHLYYKNGIKEEGLDFPGNNHQPDYLDFAYFSIVLGCTFQVSDVEISSRDIRKVAMFHGLLAFALNTFVVALAINIVAGLIN